MTRPVSQSDILPFERCPALWHATRVRNLDDGNRFSRIGTACHVACEAVTLAVLGADDRELYLVARDALTAHADAVNLPPDELHEALDIMDASTAKDSAISFYVPQGWTAVAEVDLSLGEDFAPINPDNARPAFYRGRLDRLQWNEATGELEVWDWKASHDWMSGEDVLLDVQARFYAMLALAWFPAAQAVKFKRVMLRLGYTAPATFVRGERWHGQIQDRARRLFKSIQGLESFDFLPLTERFGQWCRDCPVRGKCGTWAKARDDGSETDFDAPREALGRLLGAYKAAERELDARIRADVLSVGPIPLGDGTALGFFPKRTKTLRGTREETLAELRRMGMDEDQERAWFAASDRAFPGLVRAAIEKLESNKGLQQDVAERLLAPATGFNFEVKTTEEP